jgi:hypothetical protein
MDVRIHVERRRGAGVPKPFRNAMDRFAGLEGQARERVASAVERERSYALCCCRAANSVPRLSDRPGIVLFSVDPQEHVARICPRPLTTTTRFAQVEQYRRERGGDGYGSNASRLRWFALSPNVRASAVMMPFAAEFGATYDAIRSACFEVGLTAVRADDIWDNSTFIQDIVDLIQGSRVTVADFSGRNPNVMYETGICSHAGRVRCPYNARLERRPLRSTASSRP